MTLSRNIVGVQHQGDFKSTSKFLSKLLNADWKSALDEYGKLGVKYLSEQTPVDTGKTAASWGYRINTDKSGEITVEWYNTNVVDGAQIAVIVQYGHATKDGGWVEGTDYINPALRPIFQDIANKIWKKVMS